MEIRDRIIRSIRSSPAKVFVRKEFDRFGSYRQVSRVLGELELLGVIIRAGYGVYRKPEVATAEQFVDQLTQKLPVRTRRLVEFDDKLIALGVKSQNGGNAQDRLDDLKLRLARELVKCFDLATIRSKSLENLARWEDNDVWCSAYDEWRELLTTGSDAALTAVLVGEDQDSNRLRQSPPYPGLLDHAAVERIREAKAA